MPNPLYTYISNVYDLWTRLCITFLNELKPIPLHTVEWFQVLLCITNNSFKHQTFIYTMSKYLRVVHVQNYASKWILTWAWGKVDYYMYMGAFYNTQVVVTNFLFLVCHQLPMVGYPHCLMANELHCVIIVSSNSSYTIICTFELIPLGKLWNPLSQHYCLSTRNAWALSDLQRFISH